MWYCIKQDKNIISATITGSGTIISVQLCGSSQAPALLTVLAVCPSSLRHTPTSLAIGAEEEKSVPFASPPPSTQEEEERDILYSDNFGAL